MYTLTGCLYGSIYLPGRLRLVVIAAEVCSWVTSVGYLLPVTSYLQPETGNSFLAACHILSLRCRLPALLWRFDKGSLMAHAYLYLVGL